jgi:hypothetical protein
MATVASGAPIASPGQDRFTLSCALTVRTISGPKLPASSRARYSIDLKKWRWCLPDDGCKETFKVERVSPSIINLVARDSFDDHESITINLESGKAAGSYDNLTNGIATYLVEGQCAPDSDRAPGP